MTYALLFKTLDPFANTFRAMSTMTLACGDITTIVCKLLLPLRTPYSLTFHSMVWDTPLPVSINSKTKTSTWTSHTTRICNKIKAFFKQMAVIAALVKRTRSCVDLMPPPQYAFVTICIAPLMNVNMASMHSR